MEVHIDMTEINKLIAGHQAALMTFCAEFRQARPDQIEAGVDTLRRISATYGLGDNVFTKAIAVLRGEITENDTSPA